MELKGLTTLVWVMRPVAHVRDWLGKHVSMDTCLDIRAERAAVFTCCVVRGSPMGVSHRKGKLWCARRRLKPGEPALRTRREAAVLGESRAVGHLGCNGPRT